MNGIGYSSALNTIFDATLTVGLMGYASGAWSSIASAFGSQ